VNLQGLELRRVVMPLRSPFRTSFGTQVDRDVLLVRVVTDDGDGWGECVATREPVYSSEYVDGVAAVIERFLLPRLAAAEALTAETVDHVLAPVKGHRMAKAVLETALLDAQLRARNQTLASYLGAVRQRVPAGVSVGIMDSVTELLSAVEGYLEDGYRRIKLKIRPGWDVVPVAAVRERFGDIALQVDANAAYSLAEAGHLQRLDEHALLLVEQPLGEEDLRQHALLAQRLRTPVCLDESVVSARSAADAIAMGACSVINIKPGRVGGYLEARRVHDVAHANGTAVWCGGMLETGLGRAANLALAALPGFTLPGDISASDRYYETDLVEPITLVDGHVDVPTGAGLGVTLLPDVLDRFTVSTRWLEL
jgi:O-succinylbenzoate synthase